MLIEVRRFIDLPSIEYPRRVNNFLSDQLIRFRELGSLTVWIALDS